MIQKPRILIVEDDQNLGFLLKEYLGLEGFEVTLQKDGVHGLEAIQQNTYDLCVLDVMMPNMDGFTLAKKIREHNDEIPFIFLTARTLKTDRLNGFSIGAEDYITKPFDEEELLCRIKVCLRRQGDVKQTKEDVAVFVLGDFHFNYNLQELCYKEETHRLTEKENEVLRLLCLHQNQVLRRDEAVEQIYGKKDYFLGRSFDVFVSRLRKMLSKDPRIVIENVFKVGFILKVLD
jgi:DNA-binding response OmpR family regulator